ncbi:MAG: hypothetical protein WBD63_01755 [Phycisphaerae bacterium]
MVIRCVPIVALFAVVVLSLMNGNVCLSEPQSNTAADVTPPVAPPTADDIENAVRLLSSRSLAERNKGVLALFGYVNHGDLKDLKDKVSLFKQASTSTDARFAYKLSSLLARFPKDPAVMTEAEKALENSTKTEKTPQAPGQGGESLESPYGKEQSQIVAAITYLERYSPASVEGYLQGKEYSDIPASVKAFFGNNPNLVQIQEAYIEKTLNGYLAWVPPQGRPDQPNPFREALLVEHGGVVAYVAKNKDRLSQPQMNIGLIWLLGAIGDSACFDMLAQEYRSHPGYRAAVSLAACTGSLQIKELLESLADEQMHALLKHILAPEAYDVIKGLSRPKILDYWKEHFADIRQRCMRLSRPQLG